MAPNAEGRRSTPPTAWRARWCPKVFGERAGPEDHPSSISTTPPASSCTSRIRWSSRNLEQLKDAVHDGKADLGICFDGDADRCVVVDEKGATVGCDHLTAWLAQRSSRTTQGSAIVYDLRSSKASAGDDHEAGGKPVKSRVGHVFMKQALAEHNAIFGGELSGHFYFRGTSTPIPAPSRSRAVVSGLAAANKPMSELIEPGEAIRAVGRDQLRDRGQGSGDRRPRSAPIPRPRSRARRRDDRPGRLVVQRPAEQHRAAAAVESGRPGPQDRRCAGEGSLAISRQARGARSGGLPLPLGRGLE